jgi:hypothetical protein
MGTGAGEQIRGGRADAARATGHNRALAYE